jgi:DNA-binding transcriptional regulator YiaG
MAAPHHDLGNVNQEEESKFWLRVLSELRARFTLEYLAEEIGVSVRQVSNWQAGDKPKGMNAVRLYLFHMKHGTAVHGIEVHVSSAGKSIPS